MSAHAQEVELTATYLSNKEDKAPYVLRHSEEVFHTSLPTSF